MSTATIPTASAKVWRAYQAGSNGESEMAFIERHLSLVKTVVGRMRMTLPESVDFEELHAIGVSGLMTAVQKFDPAQSATFAAFATTHIRGAILDELRRLDLFSRGERAKAKNCRPRSATRTNARPARHGRGDHRRVENFA